MESKKDIRKMVLEKRNSVTKEEWEENSRRIFEKVVSHPFFLNADVIYCYMDCRNEVGTKEIMEFAWREGKKVGIPKISCGRMTFHCIKSFEDTAPGYFGIMEPLEHDFSATHAYAYADKNTLVIMPGVAFDTGKHRVGYGKGFYDKYLSEHPTYHTISLAFEVQRIEQIPSDEHDICPELIITEEHIYD